MYPIRKVEFTLETVVLKNDNLLHLLRMRVVERLSSCFGVFPDIQIVKLIFKKQKNRQRKRIMYLLCASGQIN